MRKILIGGIVIMIMILVTAGIFYSIKGYTQREMIKQEQQAAQESLKEFINVFPDISKSELERKMILNKLILNQEAAELGLNASQLNELENYTKQQINELVAKIQEEYGVSRTEALKVIYILNNQRQNYLTLPEEEAYQMVGLDFMSFEEKVSSEAQLPELFLKQSPTPDNQVVFYPPSEDVTSAKSFSDIYLESTGDYLPPEYQNLNFAEILLNLSFEILNTTPEEWAKNYCSLGEEREILLRSDYLISTKGRLNYSIDRIFYDSLGKIIKNWSKENYEHQEMNNVLQKELVIIDIVKIPSEWPEGTYVIEYVFKDFNFGEYRTIRVPLHCQRRLLIKNLEPVSLISGLALPRLNDTYLPGDTLTFAFDIMGMNLTQNINAEVNVEIFDSDKKEIMATILNTISESIQKGEESISEVESFSLPESLPEGKYLMLLKVTESKTNEIARGYYYFKVKKWDS